MDEVRRREVTVDEPFEACGNCGCDRSYHTLLVREDASEGELNVRILLRCPSCAVEYDVGLMGMLR